VGMYKIYIRLSVDHCDIVNPRDIGLCTAADVSFLAKGVGFLTLPEKNENPFASGG